jgi:hypothetical protein
MPQPPPAMDAPPERSRPTVRGTRDDACHKHVVASPEGPPPRSMAPAMAATGSTLAAIHPSAGEAELERVGKGQPPSSQRQRPYPPNTAANLHATA